MALACATNMTTTEFLRRTLIVLGVTLTAVVLWRISYALLLAFGAVLFSLFLRGLARKLDESTGIGIRTSLGVVGAALLALVGAGAALIGPAVAGQFDELGNTLAQGLRELREHLEQAAWGKPLVGALTEGAKQNGGPFGLMGRAALGIVDAMLGFVVILVAGAYLAVSPRFYVEGAVRLLPKKRHARAREVLGETGKALWLWLLGQFIVMALVGVLTGLGLLLAGVPLALPLGLIAGMLEFIPFLGPFLAAVPVLLVAGTVDSQTALYAVLVLIAVQQIEANLLTPLVERRTVALPPVLLLIGTIASGLLFGVTGLVFAAPLMVVVMVWTRMLYMHDALQEPVEVPGPAS
jgi:predicted PurR-regulated permease PerM